MDKKVVFIDLTLTIAPPVECNEKEANEWVDYQITGGSISRQNPLIDFDLRDMVSLKNDNGLIEYKTRIAH